MLWPQRHTMIVGHQSLGGPSFEGFSSFQKSVPQDPVQRCIQEALLFLSYTLAKKQGVDFILKDISCVLLCKSRVQMQISTA